MNGANYQTVTNKIANYKTGRGKWNLKTQQSADTIERTYNAPAAMPAIEQNLIPEKDDISSTLHSKDLKNYSVPSILSFVHHGSLCNGKTFAVEQACAQLGRELIRKHYY